MLPRANIIERDPEVQEKYDALTSRRNELTDELRFVNGEQERILASLGELVASGSKYKKQLERLAELRLETEALEAGIRHTTNQCSLLQRMNTWITTR